MKDVYIIIEGGKEGTRKDDFRFAWALLSKIKMARLTSSSMHSLKHLSISFENISLALVLYFFRLTKKCRNVHLSMEVCYEYRYDR
jgi:hypothetical protein